MTPKSSTSKTSPKTPNKIPGWPPLYLTPVPREDILRGDGPKVCKRIEALCTVSKDGFASSAGKPLILRPWQRQLIYRLFARTENGRLRHRVALIGEPRKNGKSALGSGLALDGLLFGGKGAEVYSAAAEKEQARIVFGETKRMVQANSELADICNAMRDVIEVPSTNSVYRVLSAEAYSKEGLNITRALIDELHAHPNDEMFNVLTLAMAARIDPMAIAITTAGVMTDSLGYDTVCYRLWKYGVDIATGHVDDPSFFMAWWGAPEGADHKDPEVWRAANPGYGDLIDPDDFASAVKLTPENEFRTKRLNQWVASQSAWFPAGVFDNLAKKRVIAADEQVVLAVDGSYNNDSTVITLATLEQPSYIDIVHAWERPRGANEEWVVPIEEVEQAIRDACKKYKVREVCFDPHRWARSMQVLSAEHGIPVTEYPQRPERMVPATQRFFEAVMSESLTHSGDPVLTHHIGNANLKIGYRGGQLTKDTKGSMRKIDAAVAAVIAFDRASNLKKRRGLVVNPYEMLSNDSIVTKYTEV